MTYIRFVVSEKDSDSTFRAGIFQHALRLRDEGALPPEETEEIRQLGAWFDKNLPEPNRFSRKRNPNPRGNRGISWFKDSATTHITNVRKIAAILEAHGIPVEMVITNNPGYVFYEDEHQIVAEPFTQTPT